MRTNEMVGHTRKRLERLEKLSRAYREKNRAFVSVDRERQAMLEKTSAELKEARYALLRMNNEIEEEMSMAKTVQESLMPKSLPEVVNVKSAAIYIPTGKIGGDLYDILITPRQKVAILIFDVSGHGVPAAMIGAMAKMLFAHYIEKTESPSQVFRDVNSQLCRFIRSEQYLTAFLGIFDPIRNTMTYSRAGHVPPLLFHAKRGMVSRLECKGFFIGHSALQAIAEYSEQTVQLEAGDKILFYTDGLTEGNNEAGELYGGERLKNALAENGSLEVNDVLEVILEEQTRFRAGTPLRDDFTMLCIEVGSSEQLLAESGFTQENEPNLLLVNSFDEIDRVCSFVLREMDRSGFSDRDIKQFKICIFEMITNAIMHGNREDPSKRVFVFYKVTSLLASISILDEGDGFDHSVIPNPLLPENRFKDHGRGLFLIYHYMDEVSFNEKGNRILGRKYHHGR